MTAARRHQLVIVASCTQRKTAAVPPPLHLRRYRRAFDRIEQWRRAIEVNDTAAISALGLYAGAFWSIVRDLPAVAQDRGIPTTLFVASAGYGLIGCQAALKPYSATFSSGADSVVFSSRKSTGRQEQLREWWRQLSLWGGPSGYTGPRTIEEAARRSPTASFLVIASPAYVCALADDLRRAATRLRSPDTLVIVSSVSGFPEDLRDHLVPSTGALQTCFGGTMGSLHARTARHLLAHSDIPLKAPTLRKIYERMAARVGPRVVHARESRTDAQVRSFIRSTTREHGAMSYTAMLDLHRASGFKCERTRFQGLFEEVARS